MRLKALLPKLAGVLLMVGLSLGAVSGATADTLKLIVQRGYLPGVPALVRVEVLTPAGHRNLSLWDGEALLGADAGVTLSTNRVRMRNGMGSTLVTFTGGGDFNLTAMVGALQATRALVTLTNEPVQLAGGTNAANAVWSGVVRVTNHVGVATGFALTVLPNTLVLIDGTTTGTTGLSFYVNGRLDVQGTEADPVTFTCASTNLNSRWGQMRFNTGSLATAATNNFQYAIITRGGRAPGEGHTSQAPILRPTNAKLRMEHCSITDHATTAGTPGKIGQASGSDLTFDDCLFQRARMGPEIGGTALLFTNGVIMDMLGNDDADGIYIHAQSAGQVCALKNSVVAAGGDDGIDTLDSAVLVEGCIIRDWASLVEDAKGISAFNNVTTVRRSLIVDCTVGIAAKTSSSNTSVRVNIFESTLTRNGTNVLAQFKSNATGPRVDYRITNSILWSLSDSIQSDFAQTNFTIGFCNISEPWPGTNNSMSDPLFMDASSHDFRLLPFSPSIDAGNPQSPLDPDGSPIDQGCFTFQPGPPLLSQPMLLGGVHQFTLNAYSNRNYVVESSDVLPAWTFLQTVFQTNDTGLVLDATATNTPHRFYRARLVP
jgi:hypothetical protein